MKDLEHLALEGARNCGDETVSQIVKDLPKLRSLDLSATEITGVAVKEAVQSGHLEGLTLKDCRFLGRDAVEWARSQGVAVQYRMNDQVSGGRKIRY